jgi:hypothetical protein
MCGCWARRQARTRRHGLVRTCACSMLQVEIDRYQATATPPVAWCCVCVCCAHVHVHACNVYAALECAPPKDAGRAPRSNACTHAPRRIMASSSCAHCLSRAGLTAHQLTHTVTSMHACVHSQSVSLLLLASCSRAPAACAARAYVPIDARAGPCIATAVCSGNRQLATGLCCVWSCKPLPLLLLHVRTHWLICIWPAGLLMAVLR